MNTRTLLSLSVVGLALGLSALVLAADPSDLQGKPAPDFTLTTLDGQTVKLSEMKGKVVLIDFWATWCPPCRKSLPHVQDLSANANLAKQGLVVWAVNAKEKNEAVQQFLKQNNYTFTVPMDSNGTAMGQYGVRGIPTTVIVGRDGTVQKVFVGFGGDSAKNIDTALQQALSKGRSQT